MAEHSPQERPEVVVLFSGGSDSTLTAAIEAEGASVVHLLTFRRFGIFHTENSQRNVPRLRRVFGEDRFLHRSYDVDGLFRWLSYEGYLGNARRHGFMLLSTCGLCKLAMHLRALLYCLEHGIHRVADGANRQMNIYPAQMRPVLEALRGMYARHGIEYANPVFDYDGPSEMGFHPQASGGLFGAEDAAEERGPTTDRRLYELGILDAPSTKGSQDDHAMQPRCFQFLLFRVYVHWLYLPTHGYEAYERETAAFHRAKIDRLLEEVERWRERPESSALAGLIDGESRT
jgi:hypothetical protein